MISRRATLALGASAAVAGVGGVVAHREGVLDDGLRGVGVKPHPEPDPGDVRRLAQAGDAAQVLRANIAAALAAAALDDDQRRFLERAQVIVTEHAHSVSSSEPGRGAGSPTVHNVVTLARTLADDRARDALKAVSPEVAQVLASMAAGLDQLVVAGERVQ
jgi:hypothetical protein